MSIPTPPTPYFRIPSFDIDDESSFTGAKNLPFNHLTRLLSMGSIQVLHEDRFADVADAIERLHQQDFSPNKEVSGYNIDAVIIESVTVQPAFQVSLEQVNDLPSAIVFTYPAATLTWSVGTGWSLAKLFRSLGYGTEYTPPT